MARYDSNFGRLLIRYLADRRMTQRDFATAAGLSEAQVSKILSNKGGGAIRPHWADLAATTLDLTGDDRKTLHVAAAKDSGYDLD